MRLAIHSDLHPTTTRTLAFRRPAPADVVVIAGDVGPACWRLFQEGGHGAAAWVRRQVGSDIPVIMVLGNHDYAHFPFQRVLEALARVAREHDIHFLHNQAAEIEGVRFLGTPLFPCMKGASPEQLEVVRGKFHTLMSPAVRRCICGQETMCGAGQFMPVRGSLGAQGEILGPAWLSQQATLSRAFLERALAEPHPATVVVTHWAPSFRSLPERERAPRAEHVYWATPAEDLVARAHLWVHGHLHDSCDYRIGDDPARGRVVCNPHGNAIVGGFLNPGYREDFVVDLPTPVAA